MYAAIRIDDTLFRIDMHSCCPDMMMADEWRWIPDLLTVFEIHLQATETGATKLFSKYLGTPTHGSLVEISQLPIQLRQVHAQCVTLIAQ